MDYDVFLEQRRRLIAQVIQQGFARLSGEQPAEEPDLSVLIAEGESRHLEFKSSARWNMLAGGRDPELEWVIVKTIAGLANADGGTLLIGVDDDGQALGLEQDLKLMGKPDVDRYELWLRDLFEHTLGKVTASGIRVTFPCVGDVPVCRVDVPTSTQPEYANRPKGERSDDFYVRAGNSTRKLTPQEVVDFLQQRAAGVRV